MYSLSQVSQLQLGSYRFKSEDCQAVGICERLFLLYQKKNEALFKGQFLKQPDC